MTDAPRPLWAGRALALLGIVLFAFSLRSAVASLSPVLDHVARDFAVSGAVVGLIGTAPPVCYAIFGLLAPQIERRLGLERLVVIALIVATLGLLARGLAVDGVTLILSTALIFAAVGTGNVLLPPLVKKYFPDRIGLMTTIFSTTMALSTFIPPLIAVPVADAAGWRVSLGLWAVFAGAALIPWLAILVHEHRADPVDALDGPSPRVFGRLWRIPLAWALMGAFAVSSTIAYTCFAWLPSLLVDIAHVTPAQAGLLLSLFAAMGLPCSLLVPILVARFRIVRSLFALAVVTGVIGFGGLLLAPATATILWVVLIGIPPLLFPLVLVMINLRTRTQEGSVALSGFTQSIGYAIAALFPFTFGLVHEATGSWVVPLCLLLGVVLVTIPVGFVVARPGTIEDAWEARGRTW